MKNNHTMTTSVIELGKRAKLIRDNNKHSKLCNYADNYYGDQHCLELSKSTASPIKHK